MVCVSVCVCVCGEEYSLRDRQTELQIKQELWLEQFFF